MLFLTTLFWCDYECIYVLMETDFCNSRNCMIWWTAPIIYEGRFRAGLFVKYHCIYGKGYAIFYFQKRFLDILILIMRYECFFDENL